MIRHDELAHTFVELADTLVDDFEVTDFLHRLTDVTVQVLDAQAAGLMLADQRGALSAAATSGDVEALESLELRLAEGPCVDCFAAGEPVVNVGPAEAARRWPRFHLSALATGYASVHSIPMRLRHWVIGAINIYFVAARTLDDTDLAVTQALADVATIALLQERIIGDRTLLTEQLQGALTTRILIEQAKGGARGAVGHPRDAELRAAARARAEGEHAAARRRGTGRGRHAGHLGLAAGERVTAAGHGARPCRSDRPALPCCHQTPGLPRTPAAAHLAAPGCRRSQP